MKPKFWKITAELALIFATIQLSLIWTLPKNSISAIVLIGIIIGALVEKYIFSD